MTAWYPLEMTPHATSQNVLVKEFEGLDPGTYQYKFRQGHDNDWALDPEAETGT